MCVYLKCTWNIEGLQRIGVLVVVTVELSVCWCVMLCIALQKCNAFRVPTATMLGEKITMEVGSGFY